MWIRLSMASNTRIRGNIGSLSLKKKPHKGLAIGPCPHTCLTCVCFQRNLVTFAKAHPAQMICDITEYYGTPVPIMRHIPHEVFYLKLMS